MERADRSSRLTPRDAATGPDAPDRHRRLARRALRLVAQREVTRADPRLEVERWLDDGGSFSPEGGAHG
jgi:hypothetical protein